MCVTECYNSHLYLTLIVSVFYAIFMMLYGVNKLLGPFINEKKLTLVNHVQPTIVTVERRKPLQIVCGLWYKHFNCKTFQKMYN